MDFSRGANDAIVATNIRKTGETIRGSSTSMTKGTHSRERDWHKSGTSRESFGRVALPSLAIVTPIAYDGTQDAKSSGMLCSGKT